MLIQIIQNRRQKFTEIFLFSFLQKHILQIEHSLQFSIIDNQPKITNIDTFS
jgi:hypothetical protein